MNPQQTLNALKENIACKVIIRPETLDNIVNCLLCEGHLLLEDMPGTGKTTLAKTLSASVDASFKRIQFVPDLLPSDILGINYFNQQDGRFVFRQGPLFANIVLADEINRATPRTQSALLECMEEKQITVDNVTHPLQRPYYVIATQNPIETSGVFPLPEAQLDRFFMKLSLEYPTAEMEREIITTNLSSHITEPTKPVCNLGDIQAMIEAVRAVKIDSSIIQYISELTAKTRTDPAIRVGVSPRGAIALARSSMARALMLGREFVLPDDVKAQARAVLPHRIITAYTRSTDITRAGRDAIDNLLNTVGTPV